jgi:hypothetical protein
MAGDRARAWISASAFAGAAGGLAFPDPPDARALVGLAQGALRRHWVDWWSGALTPTIASRAAFALARAFADLNAPAMATSWGGHASGTALALRTLKPQTIR